MANSNFFKRVNKTAGLYILILSLVAGGCKKHDTPTPAQAVNVEVKVMSDGISGSSANVYSGTVESADASTVSFSVGGTITEMYAEVGQKINKGQILARVKSETLSNASNIARAELEQARDAYNRLKKLHDANALPDVKWVEVQSKLKQAENAADIASRAVGDATIYAPISGYVSEKFADIGQTVVISQPIYKIVNLSDLRVVISVTEEAVSGFRENGLAEVSFDGPDSIRVGGKISQKSVVANPLTRSYDVKYSIPNPGGRILPGMIGNVAVKMTSEGSAPVAKGYTLPSKAVLLDSENKQFVWIVRDGKAEQRYVTSDEFSTDGVRVHSGLAKGDSVIISGVQKVGTGTKVKVVSM